MKRIALGAFLLVLAPAVSAFAGEAPADTLRPESYLEELQRRDHSFYPEDLLEVNRSVADSGLAVLDSLGFPAYRKEVLRKRTRTGLHAGPADRLLTYNRVEGLVAGVKLTVGIPLGYGVELHGQGAYAVASKRFRHRETLRVRLSPFQEDTRLELGFADHVVPYGSNRPAGNALRALVGAADEQDYLRRREGWVGLTWAENRRGTARLRYETARETSVSTHTDFSLFGNHRLLGENVPVDEGWDRALAAEVTAGSWDQGRQAIRLRHRVAGGALGGSFSYSRFEAEVRVRRYLPGNPEVVLEAGYVRVGGSPPRQEMADLGGLSTVRGFDRRSPAGTTSPSDSCRTGLPDDRTRVGKASFHARLELLLPFDLLRRTGLPVLRSARVQFVPWADAGRVWRGNSDRWLTAAGLGLQRYLGPFGRGAYLRFDIAVPLGPDRPDDLRFYLRFARGWF